MPETGPMRPRGEALTWAFSERRVRRGGFRDSLYYVDWGDGTTTGPHGFEGGPWPDGRITHQYIDVGTYDVVVTERWTATWRLGPASGVLSELRTTGRIEDFPVQQIQAVRYS